MCISLLSERGCLGIIEPAIDDGELMPKRPEALSAVTRYALTRSLSANGFPLGVKANVI